MPRACQFPIVLFAREREALEKIAGMYTSLYLLVVRAKLVLLASEELDNEEIGRGLSLPWQIVSKWGRRFFDQRLVGLDNHSRAGRPIVFPPSGRDAGKGSVL